jgi:hypothetical protein
MEYTYFPTYAQSALAQSASPIIDIQDGAHNSQLCTTILLILRVCSCNSPLRLNRLSIQHIPAHVLQLPLVLVWIQRHVRVFVAELNIPLDEGHGMLAKTELRIVHPGGAIRDDLFDSTLETMKVAPTRCVIVRHIPPRLNFLTYQFRWNISERDNRRMFFWSSADVYHRTFSHLLAFLITLNRIGSALANTEITKAA